MTKRGTPTLQDIATAANLSRSTVSRALNDSPRISSRTKDKVKSIAKKIGYSPHIFARGLSKGKTYLIGIIGEDFRNIGLNKIAISAQEAIENSGYWAITTNTMNNAKRYQDILKSWSKIGIDGILHAGVALEDTTIEGMLDDGFPVVFVNRRLQSEKGDYVIFDNSYGTYLAVNHLYNLGCRRIGFIHGPLNHSTSADRYEGFRNAFKQLNMEMDKTLIREGSYDQESGYRFGKYFATLKEPPEAIFCCDDSVALGAIRALGECGLNVPDDMAIVGMDDIEISSHPLIQLTTVRQDLDEMGSVAANMLIDRIEGRLTGPYKKVKLEPLLIIRRSCGYKRMQ
jgi:LacI family transcriptional regulator